MPRLLALLAVVLSFAAAQAHAQTAPSQPEAPPLDRASLIEALQGGGYVLVIRHERTEVPSRRDDYTQAPDDCRAQRNLSVAGAAGAQETGVILKVLGIEAGRVLTSPMCRSAETARYVFGVGYEIDMRLMHG
ncbi:MAG: hypothetical protein AAF809_03030, partial [Bacteroidota bacterium]